MSLSRFRLLNEQDLTEVLQALSTCQFIDGKLSATGRAKAAKANTQVLRDEAGNALMGMLEKKLLESALLQVVSFPKLIGGMLVNSYEQGQTYGWHVDGAVMKDQNGPFRTDLSFTLALTPASDYEGGVLEMWEEDQLKQVKLEQGEIFLYPTGKLHRVTEVTKGRRVCCVGWMQSWIQDADLRDSMTRLRTLTIEIDKQNLLPENMIQRHLEVYHSLLRNLAK